MIPTIFMMFDSLERVPCGHRPEFDGRLGNPNMGVLAMLPNSFNMANS